MLEKHLQFSNNCDASGTRKRDRQRPPNPALWFYLTLKQSGFAWGQLAMGAE